MSAFTTTQWTVVLAAGQAGTPGAAEALARLCEAYWYPLYAHCRRLGHCPEDAQDLTQEFFRRLIEQEWLADVAREKGRFRSFLLAALRHFLANERERGRAKKRGGDAIITHLDTASAETRFLREPADPASADRLFDRQWALTLLDRVLDRLRVEQQRAGKLGQFDALKPALLGDKAAGGYTELGATLGLSEGAVKVAVHRLRQRYRELLREEVATTVATTADVEDELQSLFAALRA